MKIFTVDPSAPDEDLVAEAADLVRQGGIVAFPTETVYGLAASAGDPAAVDRLGRLKQRPPQKPYSFHFGNSEDFFRFAGRALPPKVRRFAEAFCPGPVTMVYFDARRSRKIGVRIPDHPVASAFLSACRVPVFAPSANPASLPSPTEPQQVAGYFPGGLDGLIDAGPCRHGRDSTVVEIGEKDYSILRHGALREEDITAFFTGD